MGRECHNLVQPMGLGTPSNASPGCRGSTGVDGVGFCVHVTEGLDALETSRLAILPAGCRPPRKGERGYRLPRTGARGGDHENVCAAPEWQKPLGGTWDRIWPRGVARLRFTER